MWAHAWRRCYWQRPCAELCGTAEPVQAQQPPCCGCFFREWPSSFLPMHLWPPLPLLLQFCLHHR